MRSAISARAEMPVNPIAAGRNCDDSREAAVQPLPPGVSAGVHVQVRGGAAILDATVAHEDCRELRLTVGPNRIRRTLLWPFDRPSLVRRDRRLRSVRLRTWLQVVNATIATSTFPVSAY